jgi:hypothetical protein
VAFACRLIPVILIGLERGAKHLWWRWNGHGSPGESSEPENECSPRVFTRSASGLSAGRASPSVGGTGSSYRLAAVTISRSWRGSY